MRSIRYPWLSLLCGALIMVASACTRTEQPERADTAEEAQSPPAEAAGADETFAPSGNRLADDGGAGGSERPATGEVPAPATGRDAAGGQRPVSRDTVSEPRSAATNRTERIPADRGASGASRGTASPPPPAPVTRVITIPEGTSLPVVLTSAVASDTSQVEDPVSARLASAVDVDGTTVIPQGSVVRGTVSEAARSARVKGRAYVAFRFHTLVIGEQSYDIRTAPVARQAEQTKKKDAQKVAVPAAAGGVIGAIAGGGKGAAIGAAAGAAAGTGAVLATRGQEVRLPAGTRVTTTLSAPLDVTVKN